MNKPEITLKNLEVDRENQETFFNLLDAIEKLGDTQTEDVNISFSGCEFIEMRLTGGILGNCRGGLRRKFALWLKENQNNNSNEKQTL